MRVGIYIYDDAEVLDFSGPYEVFSTANRLTETAIEVFLVAEAARPVVARGGYRVLPDVSFHDTLALDVLIVAGGVHTAELRKPKVIEWLKTCAERTQRVASVCTGAFLLAEAGLLDGRTVTTHWEDIPDLARDYPALDVVGERRWVSDGAFTTSGGISAGIDMSLYLLAELTSPALAEKTARQMEYRWVSSPEVGQ